MPVTRKNFGKTPEGKEVTLYTIQNSNGVSAEVTNFGAILVRFLVPDKKGNVSDIVLGYDNDRRVF